MIVSIGGIAHSADPYKCRGLLTCMPSTKYAYGYRRVATGTETKTGLMVVDGFAYLEPYVMDQYNMVCVLWFEIDVNLVSRQDAMP